MSKPSQQVLYTPTKQRGGLVPDGSPNVATEVWERSEERKVNVLRLQGMADSGLFMTTFLIPVRGLLGPLAKDMLEAELTEVVRFLDQFEAQFGVGLDLGRHVKADP